MKLFGKDLFNFRPQPGKLYDFAQHGILNAKEAFDLWDYVNDESTTPLKEAIDHNRKVKKTEEAAKEKPKPSPKVLYKAGALNDHNFKINVASGYLDAQIVMLEDKLGLLGEKPKKRKHKIGNLRFTSDEELGSYNPSKKFSREELESMIDRLNNRRRITEFNETIAKYPHTTSELVNKVINDNLHLRAKEYTEFIPDLPNDAVKAINEYNGMCIKLCNKETNFYIIASKKDFEKAPARRDPILLAQSPFGFFWQILGAWDEEMIYLGDL